MVQTEKRKPSVKLSADELETGAILFIDGGDKALAEGDEMIARAKLGEMTKALSLSYIAEKYFGKSHAWLIQKVKGNIVHGKRKAFTDSEREIFREALQNLSEKMSEVAMYL